MAILVSQVFADVLRIFPDIPQPVFLDYLNEIDRDYIQPKVRLVPQQQVSINLTAATVLPYPTYTLDPAGMMVWKMMYVTGVNSGVDLTPTTFDYLDYRMYGWRIQSPGTPAYWYYDGGQIGFYPASNLSTVGGFPVVYAFVTEQPVAMGSGDSLPPVVHTDYPWVYGICMLWASAYHQDRLVEFTQKFERSVANLKAFMSGHNIRRKNKIIARIPWINFR